MLTIFDGLRDITFLSVIARMALAVVCGGAIGFEREYKRRSAGFRTHILVCLGAAMTTLTSQYLCLYMNYFTDLGRLGAQVVAGIGFIGAGTIIVSRGSRVKGLTTAAGLWTAAIIGLALGFGFCEGALLTTAAVLLAELVFSKLEFRVLDNAPEVNLYLEYTDKDGLERVLRLFREYEIKVLDMEITRAAGGEHHSACVLFSLRLNRRLPADALLLALKATEGVVSVEEL